MPREPDIGWQHGKMIGGHRHHVQCNYCHRTMIGGVTRFKKHLASKKGEIKGCDAVPKEVRDIIRKHLAAAKTRKRSTKKDTNVGTDVLNASISDKDTESDESGREIAAGRLESLQTVHEGESPFQVTNESKEDHQLFLPGTREFFDAVSIVPSKDDQGLAPPRATDLGWAHGMMVNGDRQKIKCRYCQKVILGGGISRLKQHLAGERGNIAPCEKVPEDVKAQMHQHLGFKILERLQKQKESEALDSPSQEGREEENSDMVHKFVSPTLTHIRGGKKRAKRTEEEISTRRRRKMLTIAATPVGQSYSHIAFAPQESINQADVAVAKFVYDVGLPLGMVNSLYFQPMVDAICAVGPGYKVPSYHALRGKLLKKIVHETRDLAQEMRKSWETTGCSVIADRWMNKNDQIVVHFLVYCPKGTLFLKSVDASEISSNPESLMVVFDSIVQDVGPKNVVNFVTDCSPSFKTAGKLLMSKYKTFFWSGCASHCVELMLENIAQMDEVKETILKSKGMCQIIYNHPFILNLLRKATGGRDLIQPAISKFATDFLSLQTITSLKEPLHQMFTSDAWVQSPLSKHFLGVELTRMVLDQQFWSSCEDVLKVTKPLTSVLHIANCEERPSMGYIYEAMDNVKGDVKVAFSGKASDYSPYLKIIEGICEEQLHSPLHAAAYYLNPSIFYSPGFSTNKVIQKGLLDCIETLEPNLIAQDMITRQIAFYEDAVGDFSRPVALRGRGSLSPATWWSLYASDYPDLQRFAIRILSQTCSTTRCKKDLNILEQINPKLKNRLESERLNDLLYVHYNLSLQQRQMTTSGTRILATATDPLCSEGINATAADWIEDPGVLIGDRLGWMDVVLPGDTVETTDKKRCRDSEADVIANSLTSGFQNNMYDHCVVSF
ncbi:hypothetical protein H6P81_016618 [Aristolochia fimbriata]|uniref:BED-type domain-containing protein n=1 Tax=Aristolochia fimbriata TaxID=158543 RepID=A0AAV7EDF6_ARIFI|nr:hypothetical protein H6P81_016618 [Aristolochia fimbriata]